MYYYRVYGLQVRMEFEAPWLTPGGDGSDLLVRAGDTPAGIDGKIKETRWFQAAESELLLFDDDGGRFWVRPGVIVVTPGGDLNSWSVFAHILGSCMGAVLQWRNQLVLHASAVRAADGGAIIFCGHKTAGKSTMAGFFHHYGRALLNDDVCPLALCSDGVYLSPGFPRIKLDPSVLLAMEKSPDDFQRLPFKTRIKHAYPAIHGFSTKTALLRGIFLLEEEEQTSIVRIDQKSAVPELFQQCFRKAFFVTLEQKQQALAMCAALAERTPVYRLRRPKKLSQALNVVRLVTESIESVEEASLS
ncbi:hypothetical protein EUZ85_28680 [Hahella sp. KA22]|uniref:hypothetical protein n=1 Tax=Hahella sp. KA22 TaxID=1628392 RepID=UPI000FDF19BC|nr:hypothetical protein [Hahella sp. KA22]AZZ94473.1 hypothetical protein ENC22_26095 [Hahella sp. KA22]QAY57846.1 hypothetical protein EUZ85_28680 [Hahella sp. KA22]